MKRLFVFVLMLALTSTISYGQRQFKEVEAYYLTNMMDKARTSLDKALAKDPSLMSKPEAHLWIARVYSELYNNDSIRTANPDLGKKAYDALKKYMEMQPDIKDMKDVQGRRPILIIYSVALNNGINHYKGERWKEAYEEFRLASEMGDIISQHNFANSPQKIDTISVLYAGVSAQNAKMDDVAVQHFRRIADEKIAGPNDLSIYAYIIEYYMKKKDEANFKTYVALARELYPKESDRWDYYTNNYISQNFTPAELMAKFKQEDQEGKLTAEQYENYGSMLGSPSKEKQASMDSATLAEMRKTAAEAYKKAFAMNSNGLNAFNAAIMYYNEWVALDERYAANRGQSPALKAKRDQIEKEQHIAVDKSLEWLNKAYTSLKAMTSRDKVENATLNKTVDYLANLYAWKRDKSKGKNPKDYDAFDLKFKQFDKEHGKY